MPGLPEEDWPAGGACWPRPPGPPRKPPRNFRYHRLGRGQRQNYGRLPAATRARPAARPMLQFAFLAAALVAIVGLGLIFRSRARGLNFSPEPDTRLSAATVTRLQSGLAGKK